MRSPKQSVCCQGFGFTPNSRYAMVVWRNAEGTTVTSFFHICLVFLCLGVCIPTINFHGISFQGGRAIVRNGTIIDVLGCFFPCCWVFRWYCQWALVTILEVENFTLQKLFGNKIARKSKKCARLMWQTLRNCFVVEELNGSANLLPFTGYNFHVCQPK